MTSADRVRSIACRPLWAAAGLLLLYVGLSFLDDPGGYLGTDTGAKVATLEVMDRAGTASPDLGYWAEEHDPTGRLHPIYDTHRVDDGWVHVTTLPMLELARPLYAVGGYRLTLLLPMLGAIGAAFAARSIARRGTGSEDAGWLAYWVVGVASPIAVYALDFWEHTPGVACMVGAVALLWGVVDDDRVLARAGGAGLLLGIAATMRTEAFVYAVVAVGAAQLLLVLDGRRWRRALHVGIAAVVGFGVPWGANVLLERWLGGAERGGRVGGAATAGLGGLGDRAREAGITLLALRSGELGEMLLIGGCSAGLVVGAVLAARRGRPTWVLPLLLAAAGVQVASLASGLGFVPGMFAAAPIALVGLVTLPRSTTTAYPLVVAVAALPFVWAFQFLGGALPQWGGRYALASCILLVAVGAGALATEGRALRVGLVALSLLVTGSGVLWLQERSRGWIGSSTSSSHGPRTSSSSGTASSSARAAPPTSSAGGSVPSGRRTWPGLRRWWRRRA